MGSNLWYYIRKLNQRVINRIRRHSMSLHRSLKQPKLGRVSSVSSRRSQELATKALVQKEASEAAARAAVMARRGQNTSVTGRAY